MKAIIDAPVPINVNQLQSFLGLRNYYRNFVPSASTILSPIKELLKKVKKWDWPNEHKNAFNKIKSCLLSDQVLMHFKPKQN